MFFLQLIFFYSKVLFPDTACIDSSDYMKKIDGVVESLNVKSMMKGDIFYESCNLVSIGKDIYNREQFLDSKVADVFLKMVQDAKKDSINLYFVSGFRSFDDQKKIIQNKLDKGYSINKILKENKLPGYSEHHMGTAIDFTSKELRSLSISFEKTKEFKWLVENANSYNFYLSYPKDNKEGIMYEPWHWTFKNND